jgi:DNA-binding MarR family transcriptional regulator
MDDGDVGTFRSQMKLLQRRLRREPLPAGGLSGTAWRVLATINRLEEGPLPGQVADELQMTSSNVAAALRELDAAGFIRRERDAADARRVRVFVTKRGAALVAEVRSERDTWLGGAVESLLDEKEQRLLIRAGALMERLAGFEPEAP